MNTSSHSLEATLDEIFARHASEVPESLWSSSRDRWLILVSCILFAFGDGARHNARRVTDVLDTLGLLDIEKVAELADEEALLSEDTRKRRDLSLEVLSRLQFAEVNKAQALQTIVHMARFLKVHYEGSMQLYLRKAAARIIEPLATALRDSKDLNHEYEKAMNLWLQVGLGMPIISHGPEISEFCSYTDCSVEDLYGEAYKRNIDVVAIESMIIRAMSEYQLASTDGEQQWRE